VSSPEIAVYGAGGHGKVVADVARSAGWLVTCFVDDASARSGSTFFGAPIRSWVDFLSRPPSTRRSAIALGIGDNAARERVYEKARARGVLLPVLVHHMAVVAPTATLGDGTVVMAGAVVNPDAQVGVGVILNTGSVVEHDCVVGVFAHLSPNSALGGAVHVGNLTHLGLGAVVLPGVRIGNRVRVGAGGAVIRDVDDDLTVVGVPARPVLRPPGGGDAP
jgi:sugar O-acyltransferase (sialic acid O-acetyltransferase NeuD family)